MNPRAKISVISGLEEVRIEDLWQADEDWLKHIDLIKFELPNGEIIEIQYRRTDGYLSIMGDNLEIIPRASDLIYIKNKQDGWPNG